MAVTKAERDLFPESHPSPKFWDWEALSVTIVNWFSRQLQKEPRQVEPKATKPPKINIASLREKQIRQIGEHRVEGIQNFIARLIVAFRLEKSNDEPTEEYIYSTEYYNFINTSINVIKAIFNLILIELEEVEDILDDDELVRLSHRMKLMIDSIEANNTNNVFDFTMPGLTGKKFTFQLMKQPLYNREGTQLGYNHRLNVGIPNRTKKLV